MEEKTIIVKETREETVIQERVYKTPKYMRDCVNKHNRKIEIIRADFPIGTKERMRCLGIEKYGPFIRSNILKLLDILEKEYLSTADDVSEYEDF